MGGAVCFARTGIAAVAGVCAPFPKMFFFVVGVCSDVVLGLGEGVSGPSGLRIRVRH